MIATPKRLINSSPLRKETRVTIGPNIQLEVNIQQNKQVAKKRNVMSWMNFKIPMLITGCVAETGGLVNIAFVSIAIRLTHSVHGFQVPVQVVSLPIRYHPAMRLLVPALSDQLP